MTYTLGVDLGTTTSAAAVVRDRQLEPHPLGESSLTVPSIVLPRDDGRTLIGEAAALHGGIAPVRLAHAGTIGAVGAGAVGAVGAVDVMDAIDVIEAFDAHEAMCMLLDAVVDQVAADRGGRPARVALVQPAAQADPNGRDGGPYARVAAEMPGDPMLVAAPVACATLVDHEQGLTPGSTVGVLDLGGDVSEAALVRRTGTGFDVVGRPCCAPGIGGSDIDTIVLRHIDAALDNAVSALDPNADLGALDRLLAGCRRATEQLLRSDDAVVEVGLPRMTARVRLTRAELQRLVHPHLAQAVAALERTIAETGLSADDLEAVVLVGGSARLPAAAELVAERTGRPVVVGAAPEMTAALGAALVGTPAAERPAPAPAPAVPLAALAATASAAATSGGPLAAGPLAGAPVAGVPVSGGPVAGGPVTVPATPAGGTITFPPAPIHEDSPAAEAVIAPDDTDGTEPVETAEHAGRRRRFVERSVARWRPGDGQPAHRAPAPRHRGRWSAHLRRTALPAPTADHPEAGDQDGRTSAADAAGGDLGRTGQWGPERDLDRARGGANAGRASKQDGPAPGPDGGGDGAGGFLGRSGGWASGVRVDGRDGRLGRSGWRARRLAVRSAGDGRGIGGRGGADDTAASAVKHGDHRGGGRAGVERDRSGRRVLVASATLLVLLAVGGTLLATGAGNQDGDQRPANSIQTSEHPAGGAVPGLSDPARPTSIGSTSSLDPRTGEATTSSSTASDGNRSSGDGDGDGRGSANASATDRGGDDRYGGDPDTSYDSPASDRESGGDDGTRRGDGRYASDPSDTTDPPTTGGPTVTAPERPDSPPTTSAPPAPAPQPQPEQNLVESLLEILLARG